MPRLGATASRHPRGALRLRRQEVHLVYLSCRERIRERPGDAGRLGSALPGSDLMGALGKALETEFTYMEWLWIEEELANDGFEPGPVDGKLGPTTRAATEAWQRAACQPEAHGALNAFESAVVLVCAGCAVVAVFSPALFSALVRRSQSIVLRALWRRTCTPVTGRKRSACPGTSAPTILSLRDELGSSRTARPLRGRSSSAGTLLPVPQRLSPERKATA